MAMKRTRRFKAKQMLVALVLAALGVVAGGLARRPGLLAPADLAVTDWGFCIRAPRPPDPALALLFIDDRAIAQAGGYALVPRAHLARVIQILTRAKPAVIALDVLLDVEPQRDRQGRLFGDAEKLRQAIQQAGNVVLGAEIQQTEGGERLAEPLAPYREAAAAFGPTNPLESSADRAVRGFNPSPVRPGWPAHFAAEVVDLYCRRTGAQARGRAIRGRQVLNFLGPPGTVSGTSTADLLARPDDLLPLFQGKIVCLGATFRESGDTLPTPFSSPLAGRGRRAMAGVEVLANCIHQQLTGEIIREAAPVAVYGWAFVLAALCAAAALRLPLGAAGLGIAGALAATVALGLWQCAGQSAEFPVSPTFVAIGLAAPGAWAYYYSTERRLRHQLERIFGGYVSDEVLEHLVERGRTPELGGELRECTILFSDIRDYGSLSEKLQDDPQAIVSLLNEHFSAMAEAIHRHGGTVNNFVGDLVVAVFGVPAEDEDHCYHAVCAGLEMLATLAAQNEQRAREGREPVRAGIGLHCGKVVVGNIGSPRRMHYTVIGDAVNVASRLENATKEFGVGLLASAEVVAAAGGRVEAVFLEERTVKSRAGKVAVYEIQGLRQAVPGPSHSEGA